jgi:multiple sugar transport system permease protein
MAASLVNIIPLVVLFFTLQRYFIQGIVVTGVKG